MGKRGLFPQVKWLGHDADNLPPTSAEVNNMWIYRSTPPYAFMAWCLIKNSDNFKKLTE
jgi:hypothetical protein